MACSVVRRIVAASALCIWPLAVVLAQDIEPGPRRDGQVTTPSTTPKDKVQDTRTPGTRGASRSSETARPPIETERQAVPSAPSRPRRALSGEQKPPRPNRMSGARPEPRSGKEAAPAEAKTAAPAEAKTAVPAEAKAAKPSTRVQPSTTVITQLVRSPFPYDGTIPEQHVKFLDVTGDGRRGHTSPRGGVYWEDPTYKDQSVLLSLPNGFDLDKPGLIVLFLHGNQARLSRDVWKRQQVPQQVAASGLNAALVAPQFAVDALDSSAGHFWEPGFFQKFLVEVADKLAQLSNNPAHAKTVFEDAPIVIVAYSGGYLPLAYALQWGGAETRVKGVILLDGLYAEEEKIAHWVDRRDSAFFFSAYSPSTKQANETLQHLLSKSGVAFTKGLPSTFKPGSIGFLQTPSSVVHNNFMTQAWVPDPLTAVLKRIDGFPRSKPQILSHAR